VAIAVACLGVAVTHWPALSAQAFSFDDPQYVIENPLVRAPGWTSAGRFLGEVIHPSTVRGYYQPLTMISLMLDYALGGRPEDLRQFHRTGLLLHVANTALVIVLLYLLFGHVWVAAMVGMLYGVHPITVESVAWVAERKTLLASFFALGALVAYVRYARRPRWTVYGICAALYALALMSKPTTTPLPVLLLLLDYWPLRRLNWRRVLEKVPLLVIAAISAGITILSQAQAAGIKEGPEHSLGNVPLVLCHNIVFYLHKMVWPTDMSAQYPFPQPLAISSPMIALGVIGTMILVATLLISWRWTRGPLVGWLFFFVAIFPTMGVIGFTFVIAADRYAYLPSAGLLLVLASLAIWVRDVAGDARWRRASHVAMVAAVLLLVSLEARATRRHLAHWRDTERLHRYLLEVTPGAYSARYNLGKYLADRERIDEAIREFERVLLDSPDHWRARRGLGRALSSKGRHDEAIAHLTEALRLQPDSTGHHALGLALFTQGRTEEAIAHYQQALRLEPDRFEAHVNLGNALFAQDRFAEAVQQYDEALQLRPSYARGHYNRGLALARLGRTDEAIAEYRKALEIDPNHASARRALGETLGRHTQRQDP
jgi:tetratricopeptide (TPR) repeat protein